MGVKSSQLEKWENNLSFLSLENNVIYNIFFLDEEFIYSEEESYEIELSLYKKIAKILKTYCDAKNQMINLSKEILEKDFSTKMFSLLNESKKSYMTSDTMKKILS